MSCLKFESGLQEQNQEADCRKKKKYLVCLVLYKTQDFIPLKYDSVDFHMSFLMQVPCMYFYSWSHELKLLNLISSKLNCLRSSFIIHILNLKQ